MSQLYGALLMAFLFQSLCLTAIALVNTTLEFGNQCYLQPTAPQSCKYVLSPFLLSNEYATSVQTGAESAC